MKYISGDLWLTPPVPHEFAVALASVIAQMREPAPAPAGVNSHVYHSILTPSIVCCG
jgi:hypothetical protein